MYNTTLTAEIPPPLRMQFIDYFAIYLLPKIATLLIWKEILPIYFGFANYLGMLFSLCF